MGQSTQTVLLRTSGQTGVKCLAQGHTGWDLNLESSCACFKALPNMPPTKEKNVMGGKKAVKFYENDAKTQQKLCAKTAQKES